MLADSFHGHTGHRKLAIQAIEVLQCIVQNFIFIMGT